MREECAEVEVAMGLQVKSDASSPLAVQTSPYLTVREMSEDSRMCFQPQLPCHVPSL